MAQLSYEVQELINQVKIMKQKEPLNQSLIDKYDELVALMEKVQDREWNESQNEYVAAKSALNNAKEEAENRLKNLSTTADVIEKIASAIDKVITVIATVAAVL